MKPPRPLRFFALAILAAAALSASGSVGAPDVVVLRDGGELRGTLASCVSDRCMLDGSSVERSTIAWIGFAVAEPEPPAAGEGGPHEVVLHDGSRHQAAVTGISLGEVATDRGSFGRRDVAWVRLGPAPAPVPTHDPTQDATPEVPPPPPPPPPPPIGADLPSGLTCAGYRPLLGHSTCGFWIGTGRELMADSGGRHSTTVAFRLVEAAVQDCGDLHQVFLDSLGSVAKRDAFLDLGSGASCSGKGSTTLDDRHVGTVFLNLGSEPLDLARAVLPPGQGAYEVALSSAADYPLDCKPGGSLMGGFARVIGFPNRIGWLPLAGNNSRMTGQDAVPIGDGTIRTHWDLSRVEAPCDRPPALPSGGGLAPGDSPISLGDLFLPDTTEMRPTAEAALEGVASRLEGEPGTSVEVTVITAADDDLFGTALARARYGQIAEWFTARGIDPTRVTAGSHGPGTTNDVIVRFD